MRKAFLSILVILFSLHAIYAQTTKQELALKKGNEAVKLMDNGKIEESIKLLEESQKLDPENINYPYELGYAYYLKKDYKTTIKYLEKIIDHKNANDRTYQLLGNAYDNSGQPEKAIETYALGIKKFPNSGNLHLESGIMQMDKKEYSKALNFFEKGVEVAPKYSSNYYWASKIYCASTEEVWGMIYGELFMNLERNSQRTAEISKLLFDTYKSEIKIINDTSYAVSFSKNSNISIEALSDPSKMKFPYGVGVYEPTLMFSILAIKNIDINSLSNIRSSFVDNYYSNGYDKTYPNILFDYQKQLKEANHLEAYNHWLLMKGDEKNCQQWISQNKEKWDAFVNWFAQNGIVLDSTHKFYRAQY
jgi:tetratricopeptide (TPR) repeat protein